MKKIIELLTSFYKKFISELKGTDKPIDRRFSDSDVIDVSVIQQIMAKSLIDDLIKERQNERKWKWAKRFIFSSLSMVLFGVYLFFYLTNLGYKVIPKSDVVGIVRIDGDIMDGSPASAEKVIPALKDAFDRPNVKAIVLQINSPGGQPSESERINNYLEAKKAETKKPVYAVITNTGASAAYLIAIHADKIYTGKYSLVGSIGAVMTGWDLHKVAEKYDVSQYVFASGKFKHMMDPLEPMTEDQRNKAQGMVNNMAASFYQEVKEKRSNKLIKDFTYNTGEVWTGQEAFDIGLVDGISTLDKIIKDTWDLESYDFGPRKKTPNPLLSMIQELAVDFMAKTDLPNLSAQ